MADRTIDQVPDDVPAFEGILEAVMLQALDEGRERLLSEDGLVPFTALAVGDTLFIETHPGDDADECFAAAQRTVQNARGAAAYAFCYDGYVDTNEGELDAVIAEGGVPGAEVGHAIGCLYTAQGEGDDFTLSVEDQPLYIGQAPNFMEFTLYVDDSNEADLAEDEVPGEEEVPSDGEDPDEGDDFVDGSDAADPYDDPDLNPDPNPVES